MHLLVIQNSELDPVGVVGDCAQQRGAQLHVFLPILGDALPQSSQSFDGLIILGGVMSAWEDDSYPYLRQVVELIHQFHADRKPIMGICLGSQIIARAFGANVYRHTQLELGFSPIRVIDCPHSESWLRDYSDSLHLMQWHFDTFDLPANATWLMTNDICQHQAYRIGDTTYGFQFHFEVTGEIVQSWLAYRDPAIDRLYPNLEANLAEQLDQHLEQSIGFAQRLSNHWLDLVAQRQQLQSCVER
ncbi:MAG: GMP synthase [Elainellaceae cyanobacterium]